MEQQLIFIPFSNMEFFQKPVYTKEDFDAMKIKGKGGVLRGFCCKQLEAGEFHYDKLRHREGFTQTLDIKFNGSESDFHFMMYKINGNWANYIILMSESNLLTPLYLYSRCKPQHHPYLMIGDCTSMLLLKLWPSSLEQMSFTLQYDRVRVPYPYYNGSVEVTDCTVQELMERLYN